MARESRRHEGGRCRYGGGTEQLFGERNIRMEPHMPQSVSAVRADVDMIIQVMLDLLSNTTKFCDSQEGRIDISLS